MATSTVAPATLVPTLLLPSEFVLPSHAALCAVVAIATSTFSCLLGLLVCYVYFAHSHYRVYLRSMYNSLVVGAIVLQLGQALCRIVAAGTLLAGGMTPWLCDALGSMEIFTHVACVVLVIGFYYSIMALRYNPFHCLALHFSPETGEAVRRKVWYLLAAVAATGVTATSIVVLRHDQATRPFHGQASLFGTLMGYCSIPFLRPDQPRQDGYAQILYILEMSGPTAVMIVLSVASFVALRLKVSSLQAMSPAQAFSVYIRFFTFVGYFVLLSAVQTTAYHTQFESIDTILLVTATSESLALAVLSCSFLVSERLLLRSVSELLCRRWSCIREDDDSDDNAAVDAAAHDLLYSGDSLSTLRKSSVSSQPRLDRRAFSGDLAMASGQRLTAGPPNDRLSDSGTDHSITYGATAHGDRRSPSPNRHTAHTHIHGDGDGDASSASGGLNGFTSCIQSLLVLEVEGIQVAASANHDLLQAQDSLLSLGRRGGGGGGGGSKTNRDGSKQRSPPATSRVVSPTIAAVGGFPRVVSSGHMEEP